jgi:hypothetical protein
MQKGVATKSQRPFDFHLSKNTTTFAIFSDLSYIFIVPAQAMEDRQVRP